MTRTYRKAARAEAEQGTRRRILDAAIEMIEETRSFRIRDIARAAGVTVQTVYTHFGSKGALVMAVFAQSSKTHGLFDGLARVWRKENGQAALNEIVSVTLAFWHRAWPVIGFATTERRIDLEFGAQVRRLDESRLADLAAICERLVAEGRLRRGLSALSAASLVFALTAPAVYEELVVTGRLAYPAAARLLKETVTRALVDPKARARPLPPPRWPATLPSL